MANAAATALEDRAGGFVPALIAVLVFLAIIALAAMLLVGGSAERWRAERDGRLTVQLAISAPQDARQAAIDRALAAIRAVPEVARAEPVPEARLMELLQPWLGAAGLRNGMALPSVIDIDLAADARARSETIRERLRAALPDASINVGHATRGPVLRLMLAIEGLALLVVLVLGGTLAGTVVFATQARLAAKQETIDILHLLGADDKGIVDAEVRRALRTAMIGGAIGLAFGVVTLLAFFWLAASSETERSRELSLTPLAWAALSALPLAAAVIAGMTARLTARRALAAMP
jgi:cell division transport system permease protein